GDEPAVAQVMALDGEYRFRFWSPEDPDFVEIIQPNELHIDLHEMEERSDEFHALGTMALIAGAAFITGRLERSGALPHPVYIGLHDWTVARMDIGHSPVTLSAWSLGKVIDGSFQRIYTRSAG